MTSSLPPAEPPGTWRPARRAVRRLLRPLERFLHIEAASGIVLLAAAVAALLWVNLGGAASYEHVWHTPITLGVGRAVFVRSLHFWINDGLMTLFFFVVGLEIRREIHQGELAEPRRAALPVAAALGGMVVPACLYVALNARSPARGGWGVATATDIAFAVGVLALLGRRVPAALRVLLLALAIIDDIGAIVVIAVFYAGALSLAGAALALGGVAGVVVMQRVGVRAPLAYLAPGVVVWAGLLRAGLHPTLAGVVLGLLTPARAWYGPRGFIAVARRAMHELRTYVRDDVPASEFLAPLDTIAAARREALPPVARLEHALHPWVAFGVMPLFALSNAGVALGGLGGGDRVAVGAALGIVVGLVVGKPLGILAASALVVRLGVAKLPAGVGWRGVAVVGLVAGIGFTMAIFVAGLAFTSPALLAAAKLAVLSASTLAALLGLAAGRALLDGARPTENAAATPSEAEASTDA